MDPDQRDFSRLGRSFHQYDGSLRGRAIQQTKAANAEVSIPGREVRFGNLLHQYFPRNVFVLWLHSFYQPSLLL